MTLALQGTGVSSGIAIGPAHVLHRDELEVLEYVLPEDVIDDEIQRFERALNATRSHLHELRNHIPRSTSQDIIEFIDTHLLMLGDSAFSKVPIQIIQEQHCNAEWALKMQRDTLVKIFDEMDDEYLRTRRDDIDHIVNSIQRELLNSPVYHRVGHQQEQRLSGHIIVAHDLSPAETVLLQHQGISAFVLETGGPTSHTAILSRSLGIPAIVALHNAMQFINDHETIIIDAQPGIVIGLPDRTTLRHYQIRKRETPSANRVAKPSPTRSQDGTHIRLLANIELPEDLTATVQSGADGVGLYRTEFLYMNRETAPSEEEQYEVYRHLAQQLRQKPVIIRTLDLGADKQINNMPHLSAPANNPALGLRAIRYCLQNPLYFIPQLRAILRASAHGNVKMMIPMLSSVTELLQVLRIIDTIKQQLRENDIDFDENIPLGGMIEVPAAALNARMFAEYLDFFSIGTNDLVQYTLAIDRVDDKVSYLYDPVNPAVLQLIANTIQAGNESAINVSMCGELAADPRYTPLLLGLGLTGFSMHPHNFDEIRSIICESNVNLLKTRVKTLLSSTSHAQFNELLETFVQA